MWTRGGDVGRNPRRSSIASRRHIAPCCLGVIIQEILTWKCEPGEKTRLPNIKPKHGAVQRSERVWDRVLDDLQLGRTEEFMDFVVSRRHDKRMSSSTVGIRTVLKRAVTWMKQSALFSWLHHATVTLKQSIMGNQSWPVALVRIGLWLLLLWLLSDLHMGLPCFLLALVFWVYKSYGGGPPLSTSISWRPEK